MKQPETTDMEAMQFLSEASLRAPLSDTHYRIYGSLFGKHYKKPAQSIFKDGIPKLTATDERELSRIKHWLYSKKIEHVKARRVRA